MQSNAQKLWVPNPSADLLVIGTGPLPGGNGIPVGEVRFVDQMSILQASVTRCQKQCAVPCVENVWTIEFNDIDFGDCNSCGKSVGFTLLLDRNPNFDNQTYFEYNQRKQYVFQGNLSGAYTGTQLADWFEDYINDLYNQNDQHDQFHLTVTNDGAGTLTITMPCSGLVAYSLKGIYQLPNNNLTNAEIPVFTEVSEAEEAILSREKLLQMFPQEVGHVFGEAPRDQFMWCQNICVVVLKGCIEACSEFFDNQNSGHLHTGATPFELQMYINSSSPGFNAFITQLIDAFPTPCDALTLQPGYQDGVQGELGIGVDITELLTGSPVTLFFRVGSLSFSITETTAAQFITAIDALFGVGTAAASGGGNIITFGAPLDGFGDYINVSLPPAIPNYVGE